jgi:hypothetical protein
LDLWHYTTGRCFQSIVVDGEIRTATAFVNIREKPITWFSLNQRWEPTANKALITSDGTIIRLNMEQTAELDGGLVRIGVAPETAPHDWKALRELSGMTSKVAERLYRAAIDQGGRPGEWRGTFAPVPREKWVAVEVFHEGAWVPVDLPPCEES